jgi:DNA-directed RNA polymerase specialized sigma24 family protein
MPNARSMPPEAWEQATKALVFYFSRRHGLMNAEDLTQETLAALLSRDDYEFQSSSEFLQVCYGFARKISQEGIRKARKHAAEPLDPAAVGPEHHASSMKATEMGILLDEVYKVAKANLSQKEWRLIELAADSDRGTLAVDLKMGNANNVRVHLHRARRKLAMLTGWREK